MSPMWLKHLYSLLHYMCMPLLLAYLLWRAVGNPGYLRRWPERFGFVTPPPGDGGCIWVHAVSVGEVQAAVPVVTGLQQRYPQYRFLITTTTPTGFERVKLAFGETVTHTYMPYDLPDVVNRFLGRIDPELAIVFETELWPNLIHCCHQRAVPLLLANARLSERSAAGYARVGRLAALMLAQVSAIAAQSDADATRLIGLGAQPGRVRVTGSVKFDLRLPASLHEQAQALRRRWGLERHVWVAASTHEGEDEQVLEVFSRVRERYADTLLVLVPRHPERFARAGALSRRRGFRTAERSREPDSFADIDVLVGDTMGELPLLYATSDVAFVGGSLVPVGGHNMLEPAALGVPVLFGPHVFNFAEISRRLCEQNASIQIHDTAELTAQLLRFLTDANLRHTTGQNGREFVERNGGAGDRVLDMVEALMSPPAHGPAVRNA